MQLQASEVICSFPTGFMIRTLADREWFDSKADYLWLHICSKNIHSEKQHLHPSPISHQQTKIYHLETVFMKQTYAINDQQEDNNFI